MELKDYMSSVLMGTPARIGFAVGHIAAATLAGLRSCPGRIYQGITGRADPHHLGNRVYHGNFRGSTEMCAVGISRQYSPAHGGTPLIHPPPDSGA